MSDASLENIANANTILITSIANQNSVANKQQLDNLNQIILAKNNNKISNIAPEDARSVERILGNPLTEKSMGESIVKSQNRKDKS